MYRWLSVSEITSSAFKLFNKRNSIYRANSYRGIIWEYPWMSLLIDYENSGHILLCAQDRFTQIFKKEHRFANVVTQQEWECSEKKEQFDIIIIEAITDKTYHYANWLKPFGKMVCTFRYDCEQSDIRALNNLLTCGLTPWKHCECDVLPNDPKFDPGIFRQDSLQIGFANGNSTSLGLVLFKCATPVDLSERRFCVNRMWLDSDSKIIMYSDHHETVNTIGLTDDDYFRIFYMPDKELNRNSCSLQDICTLYGTDTETGCVLLNELVAEELLCCL